MTEIEALGVVEAVEHWVHFLYGQKFEVITDHKALCSLMSSQHLNQRLSVFAMGLSGYDFTVEYRPGSSNANADGLSMQG